jgi:hypothetical protein
MSGAIPLLPQYVFMAWCLVKVQGQLVRVIEIKATSQNTIQLEVGYVSHRYSKAGLSGRYLTQMSSYLVRIFRSILQLLQVNT